MKHKEIIMTLLIEEEDVTRSLSPGDVVEELEDAFRQHGLGLAQTLPRREVRIRGKELPHADPRMVRIAQGLAFLEESGVVVLDHIFSFPDRWTPPMRVVKYLIDAGDGSVLAIIDSLNILGMRTGAAGALGAKFLARKSSRVVGMAGAGRQSRIQLRFLLQVMPIKSVLAYDLVPAETNRFCEEMSAELGITVQASQNIEDVVREADILVTATPAIHPIVMADWLSPGLHVNIVGADDSPKIEVEGTALKQAHKLVIAAEDCFTAGQMSIPMALGTINKNDVYGTIGEIIAGIKPGREREDEITIFHSPGVTLQDAAVAHRVYQNAKKLGYGDEVPDPFIFHRDNRRKNDAVSP
jgi:alanine dehydrogenase